jgi:hypothetical protein
MADNTDIDMGRVLGAVLNAIARTMPDDAFEALIASIEREAAIMNTEESFLLFGYQQAARRSSTPSAGTPPLWRRGLGRVPIW